MTHQHPPLSITRSYLLFCVQFTLGLMFAAVAVGQLSKGERPKTDSLIEAAQKGDVQTAKTLIAKGVDVNAFAGYDATALAAAVMAGHETMVKLLLENHANPNIDPCFPPLSIAILLSPAHGEKRRRMIAALLQHGANVSGDQDAKAAKNPQSNPFPESSLLRTPITNAVRVLDAEIVETLLKRGASVEIQNAEKLSLLHLLGSFFGDSLDLNKLPEQMRKMESLQSLKLNFDKTGEIVRKRDARPVLDLLIKAGLNLEANSDRIGMTPLNQAAWDGRLNAVSALLDRGAKIEAADKGGFTPLLSAVEHDHYEVVKVLLERGADVKAFDARGTNALGIIADKNDARIAGMLIDKGIAVDDGGSREMTPLMLAAQSGKVAITELLLKRGAKVNARCQSVGKDTDGTTALHQAAWGAESMRRERSRTAGMPIAPGFDGTMPPATGVEDQTQCVRLLLAAGADVMARTAKEVTPLHLAARGDSIEIIQLLLDKGAQIEAEDNEGRTPLLWAAFDGADKSVALLLKHGAKQEVSAAGSTALHSTVANDHFKTAQLLFKNGAQINGRDEKGATALHLAVNANQSQIMRWLLSHGADVEAEDAFGSPPLVLAAMAGRQELVELLLQAGADPNHVSLIGVTAAQAADSRGHKAIAEHLYALETGRDVKQARRGLELIMQVTPFIQLWPRRVDPRAEPLLREELQLLEAQVNDKRHPAIVYQRGMLGLVLSESGKPTEAVPLLQEVVRLMGSSPLYRQNPLYPEFLQALANACRAANLTEQEITALREWRIVVKRGILNLSSNTKGIQVAGSRPKPKPDSRRLADADRLIGLALIRLGKDKEAETLLRDASDVLTKASEGKETPEIIEMQEALEGIAHRAGRTVRPRLVGRYSRGDKIAFEGNRTFNAENLRHGLMGDPDFILAAHPSAKFDDYLIALQTALQRGYEYMGLPDAKVAVTYDSKSDSVRASIKEGTRYRWDALKITGLKSIDAAAFQRRFVEQKAGPESFARQLSETIASASRTNRTPDSEDTDAISDKNMLGNLKALSRTSLKGKERELGEFASFGPEADTSLKEQIKSVLRMDGVSVRKIDIHHATDPSTGLVSTTIQMEEGDPMTLKKVTFMGNKQFAREELLKFLDLKEGMPVTEHLQEQLEDKLARSLRFMRWKVFLLPAANDDPGHLELRVGLEEMPAALPLDHTLTPLEQECVAIAEWMTQLNQHDVALEAQAFMLVDGERKPDPNNPFHLVWSPRHGVRIDGRSLQMESSLHDFSVLLTAGSLSARFVENNEDKRWRMQLPSGAVSINLGMLTQADEKGSVGGYITFFGGFRSLPDAGTPPLTLKLTVSPTQVWLMGQHPGEVDEVVLDGHRVLDLRYKEVRFYWDMDTHQLREWLVALDPASDEKQPQRYLVIRPSMTTSLKPVVEDKEARETGLHEWVGLLTRLGIHDEPGSMLGAEGIERAALLLDLLSAPIMTFIREWGEARDSDAFKIPVDTSRASQAMADLWMAEMWFLLTDLILPQDTWLWELGREAFYARSGHTEHTKAVMDRITRNSDIGPLGCIFAESLLKQVKLPQAAIFHQLAAQKLTIESFEKDWRLLFKSSSSVRRSLEDVFLRLRSMDDAKLRLLAGYAGPDLEKPLHEAVQQLRNKPGEPPADMLWPLARKYWVDHLKKKLEQHLQQTPALKPADPAVVAARVNGHAILRDELRTLTNEFAAADRASGTTSSVAEVEAVALDRLIDRDLLIQAFEKMGGVVKAEILDEDINSIIRQSYRGDRQAFLKELEGNKLTLDQFRERRRMTMITQFMRSRIASEVKEPGEDELRAAYDKQVASGGARDINLHAITIPAFETGTTPEIQKRLAIEVRAKAVAKGGDFAQLAKTHSRDFAASEGGNRGTVNPSDLPPVLQEALKAMKAGDISPVIELPGNYVILWIKEEKAKPPPSYDKERPRLLQHLTREKQEQAISHWLEGQRQNAVIEKFTSP